MADQGDDVNLESDGFYDFEISAEGKFIDFSKPLPKPDPAPSGRKRRGPRAICWNKDLLRSFREAVLKRDGHKCCQCGATEHIHAHHIKPKAQFPWLAYNPENGMALCEDCHSEVHGFGVRLPRRPLTPAPKPAILDPEDTTWPH